MNIWHLFGMIAVMDAGIYLRWRFYDNKRVPWLTKKKVITIILIADAVFLLVGGYAIFRAR
jgi:hypothetical protein